MAQWYAVVRRATGEAVSFGTDLAAPMPAGREAVPIDHQPGAAERWDAATRTVVPAIPATDPLWTAYAAAVTTDARLDVIAKRLGLK